MMDDRQGSRQDIPPRDIPPRDIPIVTIDGPSGSGKGTVSYRVAKQLNWHLLDSGALYRLLALAAKKQALALTDTAALVKVAQAMEVEFALTGKDSVHLDGVEVSAEIRNESCGEWASQVAAIPGIRAALLNRQRAFHQIPGLVADGRDMGTVVFMQAKAKIYLTAAAEERAQRRLKQLKDKGLDVILGDLLLDINRRDERDAKRAVSPLRPAEDALVIDTTTLSIEAVVEKVLAYITKKLM